ncbi:MAG: aspartate aminotransferase family protein [Candidatus Riflebacteria bacterium]|nr:aspartate aminotransferase family protein [Candidatus Riflebacteria bacterium]
MDRPYYVTWATQSSADTLPLERSEGVELVLADGRRVYDMVSTTFHAAFGHSDRPIADAITRQLSTLPIASPKAIIALKDRTTRRLCRLLRLEGGKVFYTVSGAEAIENALKMARQMTGRKLVLARRRSYHGATLGALSVTGDWRSADHFSVGDWTVRIPEPQEDPTLEQTRSIIERTGPGRIAAFVLETITGMNGVIVPDPTWWTGIQGLARQFDLLLIVDEVSCGFGRTGLPFAFHHYDIAPDFVCLAKAITGGYVPFGALWTHRKVAEYYENRVLSCGLTGYAHPLGLAALGAVLDRFEDRSFLDGLKTLQDSFASELESIGRLRSVREIRAKGLLAAIELTPGTTLTWRAGIDAGLHLAVKEQMVILAPPLVMTPEQLSEAMGRLRTVIG